MSAEGRAYLRSFVRLCMFACVCIYVCGCLRVHHVTMMFRSLTSWCCFRYLRDRRLHPRHPDLRAVGRRPGSHSVQSQERRHQVLVRTEGSPSRVLIDDTAPTTTCSSGRPDVNCSNKHRNVDLSNVASHQYPHFFQCVVANITNVVHNEYLTRHTIY